MSCAWPTRRGWCPASLSKTSALASRKTLSSQSQQWQHVQLCPKKRRARQPFQRSANQQAVLASIFDWGPTLYISHRTVNVKSDLGPLQKWKHVQDLLGFFSQFWPTIPAAKADAFVGPMRRTGRPVQWEKPLLTASWAPNSSRLVLMSAFYITDATLPGKIKLLEITP